MIELKIILVGRGAFEAQGHMLVDTQGALVIANLFSITVPRYLCELESELSHTYNRQ